MDDLLLVASTGKALSDSNRVRILMMLGDIEICVCHLISVLELAPSTVSEHLSILKEAQLVHSRKVGRWSYYSINHDAPSASILNQINLKLESDPTIQNDRKKIKTLVKGDLVTCQP